MFKWEQKIHKKFSVGLGIYGVLILLLIVITSAKIIERRISSSVLVGIILLSGLIIGLTICYRDLLHTEFIWMTIELAIVSLLAYFFLLAGMDNYDASNNIKTQSEIKPIYHFVVSFPNEGKRIQLYDFQWYYSIKSNNGYFNFRVNDDNDKTNGILTFFYPKEIDLKINVMGDRDNLSLGKDYKILQINGDITNSTGIIKKSTQIQFVNRTFEGIIIKLELTGKLDPNGKYDYYIFSDKVNTLENGGIILDLGENYECAYYCFSSTTDANTNLENSNIIKVSIPKEYYGRDENNFRPLHQSVTFNTIYKPSVFVKQELFEYYILFFGFVFTMMIELFRLIPKIGLYYYINN